MYKRIVALFILMFSMMLSGCAHAGGVVWQEDFSSSSQWTVDYDGHVLCPEIPTSAEDITFQSVAADSPSGDGTAAVLIANRAGTSGLFVNGIAHRPFELRDRSTYILRGFMAPVPNTQIELMNVSLEIVINGVGHYGEVLYRLNPYVTQEVDLAAYGWIYTREGVEYSPVLLYRAGDQRTWHEFALQISVDTTANIFRIDRIGFDGHEVVVNVQMPHESKPEGYADVSQVFLETHNMNTNCSLEHTFQGASIWDQITLTRYPLNEAPETILGN